MKQFLPSKQFIKIFGSIVIVLVFVFFVGRMLKSPKNAAGNPDVSVTTAQELSERDTDNDGLPDWEEFLWKLDPENPDTDGDGVLDGQEVEKRQQELASNDISSGNPNTQTDALARQFYIFAASNPNPSNAELNSFLSSVMDIFTTVDTVSYVDQDDVLVGVESPGQYYSSLASSLLGLQSGSKPADLVVVDSLLNNNPNSATEMKDLISLYNSSALKLKDVSVPPSMVSDHVNLINSILNISGALQSILINYETDPTLAISSISIYDSAVEEFGLVMQNLEFYFQSNGII